MRRAAAVVACAAALGAGAADDAPGMAVPLSEAPGNAARGLRVVEGAGNCLLCHAVPGASGVAGDVGPTLAGVGARWSAAQLRLRIVDSTRLDADSVMPPFHRREGLARVAQPYRGKPILDAQQVEDVVAFLLTLK